jgi:hypothetical protein
VHKFVHGLVCGTYYRLSIPYPKCLGPEVSRILDFFSVFGILAYRNEIAWRWEPNLNARSIYVSYTAYVYIGFI